MNKKDAILDHILKEVPFAGWHDGLIRDAVLALGLEAAYADLLFPTGTRGVIEYFFARQNNIMAASFAKIDFANMSIRERIFAAVRARIMQDAIYRPVLKRTVSYYTMPHRTKAAGSEIWRIADIIWHACGDTSTDYNYYTKRLLLSGVISSTTLFWLNDCSPEYNDSWVFLQNRIDNVMKIQGIKKTMRDLVSKIPFLRKLAW